MKSLDQIGLSFGTDKASGGHGFLAEYENYLGQYRESEFILLEIGGYLGGSLKMWEEYFQKAHIVCVDVDSKVRDYSSDRISVEIGSAGDPLFLDSVVKKYGRPLVIIDDGSHRWDHQRIALTTLFPHLLPGGYYIEEDIHSSFEPGFSGDDATPFIEILFRAVSGMQLRGEARQRAGLIESKLVGQLANEVAKIAFVPRSAIIKKKASS